MQTVNSDSIAQALARIETKIDAKFASLENRLTGIEQQILQRIDEIAENLRADRTNPP